MLLDFKLFAKVLPHEFLNCAWMKKTKEQDSPNLLVYINRFNQVSRWTAMEILTQKSDNRRADVLDWFLSLCWELIQLRNFASGTAVFTGIESHNVQRLKLVWKELSTRGKKLYQVRLLELTPRSMVAVCIRVISRSLPLCFRLGRPSSVTHVPPFCRSSLSLPGYSSHSEPHSQLEDRQGLHRAYSRRLCPSCGHILHGAGVH